MTGAPPPKPEGGRRSPTEGAGDRGAAEERRRSRAPHGPPAEEVLNHGPRDRPRIALTFDACSGPPPGKLDGAVLRELVDAHVPATIFVGGRWAEQSPARVKALLADPLLELGSHSYRHPHLETLSDGALRRELARAISALAAQTGRPPTLLRAPYLEADARVVRIARELGFTVIGADVASGDPDPSFGKARLTRWVLSQARPGSIVVMHINGGGKHTAEALPGIVDAQRAKGFELVTVSELLGAKR
ncbi:MAG: polysaccharide deacetylase family protein [Myxococcales bacterium]